MPTIIDSLLVSLGLENSAFKKGMKETDETLRKHTVQRAKESKEHESQSKLAVESYKKIKNEIISLATAVVSVGAIKSFVASITASDAAVGRMANNIGISTRELGAWEQALVSVQGAAADADSMFNTLSRDQANVKVQGTDAKITQALAMAGVTNISKYYDDATTMTEKAMMLADAFKKLSLPMAQKFGADLGLSPAAVTLLHKGRTDVEAIVAAKRLMAPNDADAAAAQDRAAKYDTVVNKITDNWRKFITENAPLIEGVLDFMSAHANTLAAAIGGIGVALTGLGALRIFKLLTGAVGLGAGAAEGGALGLGLVAIASKLRTVLALAWRLKTVGGIWAALTYSGGLDAAPGEDTGASNGKYDPNGKMPPRGGGASNGKYDPNGKMAPRDGGASGSWSDGAYHNPGNLEFAHQPGATRYKGGRFANFDSDVEGVAQIARQLRLYFNRDHISTIADFVRIYAPRGDGKNNPEQYGRGVSQMSGFGVNEYQNFNDPEVLRRMIGGVVKMEGHPLAAATVAAGVARNTGDTSVNISHLTVNTKATDAKGIGRDIAHALKFHAFAAHATTGMP